ncbi:MAG: DUF2333 family protein [Gammaproteobacteria bacterium]|nr:DUF2333 family protein [Gammaproteobacteria bacterium]
MDEPDFQPLARLIRRIVAWLVALYLVGVLGLMYYWDREPDLFDVQAVAQAQAAAAGDTVTGDVTTAALIHVMQTVLDKPGGYLSNDVTPPGVLMDNIPRWEFGAITQARDLVRALRNDFSRSQSQSIEDDDLIIADPQLHFDTEKWLLPPSEWEYRTGIAALQRYLARLSDDDHANAQFFARADNLRDWLAVVEKRLGSLSQRLSASVGQVRVNTDLQGDAAATQSTQTPDMVVVQTPWMEIDDVFYEARGSAWALVHFLRAVEQDFGPVLENKNALVSLRQIIRELEATQGRVWSPVILNGSEFGFMSNHSLVMASYISRANAAVIDLRNLLSEG